MRRHLHASIALALAFLATATLSCGDSSPAGPTGPDDGGGSEPEPYSHTLAPGASAHDFLAADSFDVLEVEVDFMAGYGPDGNALSHLQSFLEARIHKGSITILTPTEIPAEGQGTYTLNDISDLETASRDEFTHGDTLAAYMLFVDGKFEQENVLGAAYYNTSAVFFGGAFDQASGGLGQPSREIAQAITFRHEFGHLFGLVAIPGSGTDLQSAHQDSAHGHHCDNDQCLMYYAIESTDLMGSVFGGSIPELDAACIADLQANGGK